MPKKSKAAALAGAAAVGIVVYMTLIGSPGATVAFAQVAEKLAAAKTVSFDSAITLSDDDKPSRKTREYYLTPNQSRQECVFPEQEAGSFVVQHFGVGKTLVVIAALKTAVLGTVKGGAEIDQAKKFLDFIQSLPQNTPRQLGEKQLDGARVRGFEVDSPAETVTVWADAQSGEPARIEILHKNARPKPQMEVLTNIKLNAPLDPALFNLEPPQGYAVRQNGVFDLEAGPSGAVSRVLATYAKYMDGQFPASLGKDGLEPLYQKLVQSGELKSDQLPKQDDLLQLPGHSAFVTAVVSKLKAGDRWQYYPGIKLGEKDRIAFWFLNSKTNSYSAVYGDLRTEKVTKDQLPSGE